MKYNIKIHHRRSIRLQGYNYSRVGAYFVTICTKNRECLFGEVMDGQMQLNDVGKILQATWDALPDHYSHVELDAWVIMPNHAHGIIVLDSTVGAGLKPAPTTTKSAPTRHGLPEIVRALKTFSSRRINGLRQTPGAKIWQRNYWEHIVRNESEMNHIREYIQNNPGQWEMDRLHPNQPAFNGTGVGAGFKPAPTGIREPSIGYNVVRYNDEGWMA